MSHGTATHRGPKAKGNGSEGGGREALANLGLVAAPESSLWFEAHTNLAALYLPAPSLADFGDLRMVRTLSEFCFDWFKLLGIELAIAFAVQSIVCAPVLSAVRVPLIFTALKMLAKPVVEVGAQLRPLPTQLAAVSLSNWTLSLPGIFWLTLYWFLFQLARWTPRPPSVHPLRPLSAVSNADAPLTVSHRPIASARPSAPLLLSASASSRAATTREAVPIMGSTRAFH
jgi:hypothetical protein